LEESLASAKDKSYCYGKTKVGIQPGKKFKYSGGGFTILQLLVEEVTNQSFNSYMKTEIFEPLNMNSATFLKAEAQKYDLSECYKKNGEIDQYWDHTALAAASLFISSFDMFNFIKLFLRKSNEDSFAKICMNREFIDLMRSTEKSSDDYGLGTILYADTNSGDKIFGHDGGNYPDVNTTVRINPENNDAIIVFSTGCSGLASSLGNDWVNWQVN
jgi:CubicO group peptidase (beta-lactamase class C family)